MKQVYVIVFILFLGNSCRNSGQSEIKSDRVSQEHKDTPQETSENDAAKLDKNYFSAVFPQVDDSLMQIDVIGYDGQSYNQIDSTTISLLYQGDYDYFFPHYAIGRISLSAEFEAYVIGAESYEGLYSHLWIFRKNSTVPTTDFMFVAASVGDAGESMRQRSWLIDLNDDGTLELLMRTSSTFLEIDADEDERETKIGDVEVWEFEDQNGKFVRNESMNNQEDLNNLFQIHASEL